MCKHKTDFYHLQKFPLFFCWGFPGGASVKESVCPCRRHKRPGFHAWVRKIPQMNAWQPTAAFLPGESHEQWSLALQSTGSQRITEHAHVCVCVHICTCWKRKWQPTPVFLPVEFHGQRSLVDYSRWGRKSRTQRSEYWHTHVCIKWLRWKNCWNWAISISITFSSWVEMSYIFRQTLPWKFRWMCIWPHLWQHFFVVLLW